MAVDISFDMLKVARVRSATRRPSRADADSLPLPDASVDAITFTYLLRYVPHPQATLRELARVLAPGGAIASLEFGVPDAPLARTAWDAYVDQALPRLAGRWSDEWQAVGRFLGPNIRAFNHHLPLSRQHELWKRAGFTQVRSRRMSFGGGVVTWAHRHE